MSELKIISEVTAHGGMQGVFSHASDFCKCEMTFAVFVPPQAKAGRVLLESLGLRERRGLDLIACPSCGRAEIDVIAVADQAQRALEGLNIPVQVAVMGCVVNGPGEASSADLGIAAGRHRGHLFIDGQVIKVFDPGIHRRVQRNGEGRATLRRCIEQPGQRAQGPGRVRPGDRLFSQSAGGGAEIASGLQ